jgi:cobalt-zinc-cadmium efflux system membrane fusion protein
MTPRFLRPLSSAASALAVVAFAACASSKDASAGDDSPSTTPQNVTLTADQMRRIHVDTVQLTGFRPVIEATGTVAFNGDRSIPVLSTVSGPVTRVVGVLGETVKRGQPLAYVSSPDFASAVAEYRKAETGWRNARRIAARDSALFANDAIARGDLEQAQTDVSAAAADLEAAVQNMHALGVEDAQIQAVQEGRATPIEAVIRSPIDGTVVEKTVAPGQLLQAGSTQVFTVADLSTMWIMTSVFGSDIGNVSVGQSADIATDVSPQPIGGKVDYVASIADPASKAVSVRVLAPNGNRLLRRDMFVRVRIQGGQPHQGILVPVSAVLRDDQNLPYVFVEASGDAFERRSVTLGSRVDDKYEIAGGLNAGDRVVTDGALFVQFEQSQ